MISIVTVGRIPEGNIQGNLLTNTAELRINPRRAGAAGLISGRIFSVGFGMQKCFLTLAADASVPEDKIFLSERALNELHLPDYAVYELKIEKNEIVLGPCIGLLLGKKDSHFTLSLLEKLKVYTGDYEDLRGAVIVFALDKVDRDKRLIEGYCYRPDDRSWQRGVFPYPSAMYRSVGLSGEWKDHFLSVMGRKFFNSHYFSKWKTAQWFMGDARLGPRIPKTKLCESPQDVFDMLKAFRIAYIKPVLGLRGHGVVKVFRENDTYIFQRREDSRNISEAFQNADEAGAYIEKTFCGGKFLIQQGIDLMKIYGRIADFRCIVQKDGSQKWVCQAIICRIGASGSVVSNISSGGSAVRASELPYNALPFRGGAAALNRRIRYFALEVCSLLDECGVLCGTLGLDIAADTSGGLWLIEINNRDPDPSIAMDIHDIRLYRELKTGPMAYLKALAGFGDGKQQ